MGMLFGNFSRAAASCALASASLSSAIFASASFAIVSDEFGIDAERGVEPRQRLGEPLLVEKEAALAVQRVDVARIQGDRLGKGLARFGGGAAVEADPRLRGIGERQLFGRCLRARWALENDGEIGEGLGRIGDAALRARSKGEGPRMARRCRERRLDLLLHVRRVAREIVGAGQPEMGSRVVREALRPLEGDEGGRAVARAQREIAGEESEVSLDRVGRRRRFAGVVDGLARLGEIVAEGGLGRLRRVAVLDGRVGRQAREEQLARAAAARCRVRIARRSRSRRTRHRRRADGPAVRATAPRRRRRGRSSPRRRCRRPWSCR